MTDGARDAELATLAISARKAGARFAVHVKPRASKSAILGVRGGALDVAIAAPPVDGEANAELVKLLARVLSVGRRAVTIAGGESGKQKLIDVEGLNADELRARLRAAL